MKYILKEWQPKTCKKVKSGDAVSKGVIFLTLTSIYKR